MSRARGAAFGIGTFFASTLVALGFLVLPIVAIFARVPLHRLLDQLDDPIVRDAIVLTGTTNAIALAVILLVGTPAAYFLGTHRFRGRTLVITLIELPLVLPPTVAGIGLLAAFAGRIGLLAGHLRPHRRERRLHDDRGRDRDLLRRRAVLPAPGDRRLRDARRRRPRRRSRGRRGAAARAPQRQHPAREVGPRRRRRARVRTRRRRVRRDDHVRRQPPRRHADAAAPDLPGLRGQLRRLARDQRAARGRQRRAPGHGEADRPRARQGARRRARAVPAIRGPGPG